MSPRAAWRLEAAGFSPVYDYAAGKTHWLAADLPFEGTAKLAGMFTRRGVATAEESTPVLAATLSAHDPAAFGVDVSAGLRGDESARGWGVSRAGGGGVLAGRGGWRARR